MADVQIVGPAGELQVRPVWQDTHKVVLICHPHPLYGGTMDNKVVTTLARTFRDQNISVVTFNFRGVGSSTGTHGFGVGEIDDAAAVLSWILGQTAHSEKPRELYLAGFSFGAYITAALSTRLRLQQLDPALQAFNLKKTFLIAPAVHLYDMSHISLATDTCVVIGQQDEIVPVDQVFSWAESQGLTVQTIDDCTHFFHGHLPELATIVREHLA